MKTIICDIDGTLIKYLGNTVGMTRNVVTPLPGVIDHMNRWEQEGQRRSKVEIFARNIQLIGNRGGDSSTTGLSPSDTSAEQSASPQGQPSDFEDDIPF